MANMPYNECEAAWISKPVGRGTAIRALKPGESVRFTVRSDREKQAVRTLAHKCAASLDRAFSTRTGIYAGGMQRVTVTRTR